MSPSLNSFGSNPSVSQLVWDSDLVIPKGKAIESASGKVGIVGDVSVTGSVSADDTVQGVEEVVTPLLTATNANITTPTLSGKSMATISLPTSGLSPITTKSSSLTFTVNNPYTGNMTGTMTVVGLASMQRTNAVYIDGEWAGQANKGETRTFNVTLSPGTHTVTQSFKCNVTFNCDTLSFSAFL